MCTYLRTYVRTNSQSGVNFLKVKTKVKNNCKYKKKERKKPGNPSSLMQKMMRKEKTNAIKC